VIAPEKDAGNLADLDRQIADAKAQVTTLQGIMLNSKGQEATTRWREKKELLEQLEAEKEKLLLRYPPAKDAPKITIA
jgi:hypothetical protein